MKAEFWKKSMSILLCVVMAASMLPIGAVAQDFSGAALEETAVTEPAETESQPENSAEASIEEIVVEDIGISSAVQDGASVVASGTCGDDLTWTLDEDGVLTISGAGAMTGYNSDETVPWYSVRSSITSVVIQSGVTSIGDYAFYNCSSLASITIPETVTSIGYWAFNQCESLTEIAIPDGVTSISNYTFRNCGSLSNITIPNGITSIGVSAFYGCGSLTSITIPEGVTSIGAYAFSGCEKLSGIVIPEGVSSIGEFVFEDCSGLTSVAIQAGVTSIGESAFSDCSSLAEITITEGVTSIGDSAFDGCSSLAGVIIPDSVISIGDYAFNKCSSLVSADLGDGVTGIGKCAFYQCSSLTEIRVPAALQEIGGNAFNGCSAIEAVYIEDLATWCSIAFESDESHPFYSGNRNSYDLYLNGEPVTALEIPDGVTVIPDYAFYHVKNITSVTIPDSVVTIGSYAFFDIDTLTSVTFGDNITAIGDYAFRSCDNLEIINIPDSVTSIGDYAFSGCCYERELHIGSGVKTIGDYAFSECTYLTEVVIPESVESLGDGVFSKCYNLASVSLPDGLTTIGYHTFAECYAALTEITIPDSVISIGGSAFSSCKALTSVTLPESVETVDYWAFRSCNQLSQITVLNPSCSIYDDDAYTLGVVGKTTIAGYEGSTAQTYAETYGYSFEVLETEDEEEELEPYCWWHFDETDSVLSVGGYGLMEDYELDASGICSSPSWEYQENALVMEVGDGLKSIGAYAFYACCNATDIYIPVTVTEIGESAFLSCSAISDVYYAGTEEQWAEMVIQTGNDCLTKATVHFNSGPRVEYVMRIVAHPDLSITEGDTASVGVVLYLDGYAKDDWPEPAIVVGDPNVISLSLVEGLDFSGGYLYIVSGLQVGTTSLTFTDSSTGAFASTTIKVSEKKWDHSYYLNNVPSFYPADFGDRQTQTNFAFHNLFVNNYSYKAVDGGYEIIMDVYNHGQTYGAVDVYDAAGNWIGCKRIDKFDDISSFYEVGEAIYYLAEDFFTGNSLSYTAATYSKPSSIQFTVPEGGYFRISNNVFQSPGAYLYNMVDFMITFVQSGVDLSNSIGDYQEAYVDALTSNPDVAKEFVKKMTSLAYEYSDKVSSNTIEAVCSQGKDMVLDFKAMMDELDIGWSLIMAAEGVSENVLLELMGPFGDAIEFIFDFSEAGGTACQALLAAYSFDNIIVTCIYPKEGKVSVDGVTVTPNDDADYSGAVLRVFRVYEDEELTIMDSETSESVLIPTGEYVMYNIAFVKGDAEVAIDGTVTVRIRIPEGFDWTKCALYRQEENGNWSKINIAIMDDYIYFTTDHFSLYMITNCSDNESGSRLGDVNEDGEITIADAVRVARYDAGYIELTEAQLAAADVNGDGEVTIADAVRIARYDAGYIDEL